MKHRFAARLDAMRSFQVMDLLARAQQLEAAGRDIVHMEVGEPDFVSAEPILEAGQRAIAEGRTRYSSALGVPELRAAISAYYRRWHGVDVDAERIVVTAGATGALVMLSALLLEEGDGVLMADPCYPCNRQLPLLVGGEPHLLASGADTDYQLEAAGVEAAWRSSTRGILVASPSNPTGSMLGRARLEALLAANAARGAFTIVDEIYQGLTYPEALVDLPAEARHGDGLGAGFGTVLQLQPDPDAPLYVVNSFSKYFGMTGWRIGWLVAPESAIGRIEKLAQNFYIAPSTPGQYAAIAALGDDAMATHEARRREFCARRNVLVRGLRRIGLSVPRVPEGAFYVYAELPAAIDADAFEFCTRLLEEQGVAVTPGTDFGEHRAARHLRFAYTASTARIDEALGRIETFMGALA
ncbi:MAG TPA: aminotransferase class I/II-fold pyridoxal phosphate-dependent enzyme [Pseudomonadales bacterium]|nr:aminotransferase class I/II-fold pyridoxal phosphate-dependent enzyme [Pseudomonadales bacterium]